MNKRYKSVIIFFAVLTIFMNVCIPVQASEKIKVGKVYTNPHNLSEQWRFIIAQKEDRWTKWTVLPDQEPQGTFLKKGDFLYYSRSGGQSVSVAVGVSLGASYANASATVSFNIPLGKCSRYEYGNGLIANKKGYYVIKVRRKIRPIIQFIQYRYKKNGKWTSWTKPKYYRKDYKILSTKPELLRKR